MKKLICLLLCLVMILPMVAACTKDDDKDNGTTTTTTVKPDNGDNPAPAPEDGDSITKRKYTEWDMPGAYHVYVSTSGFDTNDGLTAEKAVASVERAQEIAQVYINEIETSESDEVKCVVISIEKGQYYFPDGLKVLSGTDKVKVCYTARGGRVTFSGGEKIASDAITKCVDERVLGLINNNTVKNNLYEVDLTNYKNVLTTILDGMVKMDYVSSAFYNGAKTLEPARWPNKGEQTADVIGRNSEIVGWTIATFINYTNLDGVMKTPGQIIADGSRGTGRDLPMNVFLLDETYEHVSSWDWEFNDVYTFDCFSNDWDDMIHKITGFTDFHGYQTYDNKQFQGYVTTDRGRQYNKDMGAATGDGNTPLRRYYFMNVIEEIDVPGEYYYDYKNMKLYVYLGDGVSPDDLHISTSKNCIVDITGTSAEHVKNIDFHNINIMYSQGDAASIKYADNIGIYGGVIGYSQRYGLDIQYSTNITIKDCDLRETGATMIQIYYCNEPLRDKPLVHANILIENCEMKDVGLRHFAYNQFVRLISTTGVTVRNCTASGGKHQFTQFTKSNFYIVEYCEIYDCLTDSDDSGLFYGYEDGGWNYGTAFRYNYIHDIGSKWIPYSVLVWYQDNNTTGYAVYGNVVYNFCAGKKIGSGSVFGALRSGYMHDNLVFNTGADVQVCNFNPGYNPNAWWWQNFYGGDVSYSDTAPARYITESGLGGAWDFADEERTIPAEFINDENLGYTYRTLRYLHSEEFLNKITSTAALVLDYEPVDASDVTNKYIALNDANISEFRIRFTAKKTATDGTVYKVGEIKRFTSLDDLVDFLYNNYNFNSANTSYASGSLPSGIKMYYGEYGVTKFNSSLKTINKTTGKYEFNSFALAGRTQENVTIATVKSAFNYLVSNLFFSKDFYMATMENNLTINVSLDFDSSPSDFNQPNVNLVNHHAVKLDIDFLDEDGNYSIDLIQIAEDYNFTLLDRSKVGVKY